MKTSFALLSLVCSLSVGYQVSCCGNYVVETGEQCDGGVGCNSSCLCSSGFVPTSPLSKNCAPVVPPCPAVNFTQLCPSIADGFVCLQPNASQFLWCRLSQGVAMLMPCPPGTSCTAPVMAQTTNVPCGIPGPARVTPCGNGAIDAEEECDGGFGCNASCQCATGFVPTTPRSKNCTVQVSVNATEECLSAGQPGYFCVGEGKFASCGANGSLAGLLPCPRNLTCAVRNFTSANPCSPVWAYNATCASFGNATYFCPFMNFTRYVECDKRGAFIGEFACPPNKLCRADNFTKTGPCA